MPGGAPEVFALALALALARAAPAVALDAQRGHAAPSAGSGRRQLGQVVDPMGMAASSGSNSIYRPSDRPE